MLKATVFNLEGKKVREHILPASIFEVPVKQDLIWHSLQAYLSNTRRSTAKTKDKSERRGGGRKPWKQKGTGRARHGSIRSPLWRKGGVTFGPTTEINYKIKINKVAKRKALCMALSQKASAESFMILEKFNIADAKTKTVARLLQDLSLDDKQVLFVSSDKNEKFLKAYRNIQTATLKRADQITIYDIAHADVVVSDENSLKVWEQIYTRSTESKVN